VIVPRPDRVRRMGQTGFGWLDAGLLGGGWLDALATEELAVYAFLCLVADRQGVSWYRRRRIGDALGLPEPEVHAALKRLRELDLVAFAPFRHGAFDGFHQVLSLPAGGPPSLMEQLGRLVAARPAADQ
jgi:hypothetical protein